MHKCIRMDKNCCSPDVFVKTFRLLLLLFIIIMDSPKKAINKLVPMLLLKSIY